MAETLSRLSAGRLILGLGAGALDAEIAALGSPPLSPGEKVNALGEAIEVISGLWNTPEFTYEGKHHKTHQATITPPVGKIPIWVGSFGPRALALTGRVADGWVPSLGYASATELPAMRRRVLDAAKEAGRDPAAVRCILNVEVHPDSAVAAGVVSGSNDQMIHQLSGFLEMGFDGFNFMLSRDDLAVNLARIAGEVLPALSDRSRGGNP